MSIHPSLKPRRLLGIKERKICPSQIKASQRKKVRKFLKREELGQEAGKRRITVFQLIQQRQRETRREIRKFNRQESSYFYASFHRYQGRDY